MENQFMQVLKGRRSIRRFKDQPVEPEKLTLVLESVQWSPSWANTQCWEVIIVRDQAVKEGLQALLAPKNPATKAMVNAPLLLVLAGKQQKSGWYNGQQATRYPDWLLYDLGIATQSLCLAAHSVGLGTVVVGLFDHAGVDRLLGVPAGYEAVSIIPLGYPDNAPSAPARRALEEFTHHDRF